MSAFAPLKILFVINPGAGVKTKHSWQQSIRGYFEGLDHTIEYFIIDKNSDVNALKGIIENIRPQRVIAVGGDGTVTLVARHLAGTDIAMGILPAGSANGMAKELNIPENPADAIDITVTGEVRSCDLIQINKEICLHLSDIGLNAQLIKYFDEGRLRGKLGYARVLFKTLWNRKLMQVMIQTENELIQRNAFMVVLANASKYGTGAVINPEGAIDDGLFEVIIVRKLAVSEIFKMLFKPQPFNPQKIQSFHARSVVINTRGKVHFQIDGEYMGKIKHIEAKILPRQINLLLPRPPVIQKEP